MLREEPVVAFVSTTDLERSRAFYGGVLGLVVTDVSAFAVVLRAPGTTIRVTLVDSLVPQPFTVLGWVVADIRGRVEVLGASGVRMLQYGSVEQDEAGVWTTPSGDLVAWFADPDGNILSLTEVQQSAAT